MACYQTVATCNPGRTTTVTTSETTTNGNMGTIAALLKRIDTIQKDAIISNEANQCDNCMISAMYNTKPIAIILCNSTGYFTVNAGISGTPCNLFRIENVRNDETVVLRLLTYDETTAEVTCTTYTVVVKISCICAIQCFEPINCETLCNQLI